MPFSLRIGILNMFGEIICESDLFKYKVVKRNIHNYFYLVFILRLEILVYIDRVYQFYQLHHIYIPGIVYCGLANTTDLIQLLVRAVLCIYLSFKTFLFK